MKKKKKMDIYARRRMLLLIGIIGFVLIVKGILGLIFGAKEPTEITFLLDNKLIEVKNEILNENNIIYLSKDDVEKIFDSTIYYNDAEKELITTYNKHIALLKVDEDFMVVNDSNVELSGPMIEKNKKIYLPISEMGIVYDLEFEYSEDNKRLIADSISKEKKTAIVIKNTKLKEKAGLFGNKIEKVNQGEYVTVIGESKKYKKIRTSDGNIGFVKQSKISDEEKVREDWIEEEIDVEVLKDASDLSKNYSKATLSKDKVNVVVPTFFYISKNSEILDKTNSQTSEYEAYNNWAKENNVEVWATLSNNEEVSNSLLTYTDRNKIINALYQKLVEYHFTGVNVNFEKIDDVNSFNRFIIELTPRLKELGLKVALTNNKNVDKEKLKNIVDIIIE